MADARPMCPPVPRGRRAERESSWLFPRRLLAALLQQLGHHRRPSRLVAGAKSLPGVSVEVLVEEHQVPPVWIGLEAFVAAVDGATAVPPQKDRRQPLRDLHG